jgi:hypothetical protein
LKVDHKKKEMEDGNKNKQDKINEEIDRKIKAGIELSKEESELNLAKVLTDVDMDSKMSNYQRMRKALIKSGLIKDPIYDKKKKERREIIISIIVIVLVYMWMWFAN